MNEIEKAIIKSSADLLEEQVRRIDSILGEIRTTIASMRSILTQSASVPKATWLVDVKVDPAPPLVVRFTTTGDETDG